MLSLRILFCMLRIGFRAASILHELHFGELTYFREGPQSPYYGASDTTPLFLVLLDEYGSGTSNFSSLNSPGAMSVSLLT